MNSPPVSPLINAFSPVKVADSPCHSQKGNLTGSPRKVKDSVADIFNSIQQWNNLHVDGLVLLRRISEDLPSSQGTYKEDANGPQHLQSKFDLLMNVKTKLVEIVDSLRAVYAQLQGLEKLERLNRNYDPIFLTWSVPQYVNLSKQVYESYRDQLNLNLHIIENLAFVTQKSARSLIALWLHQPCVDPIINFKVDSALKETGFA